SDVAFLSILLEVEAAWTEVLADVGMVPARAAATARQAADPRHYDLAGLAQAASGGGNPLIPVLKAMRTQAGADAHAALHLGATSQDVIDTALMMMTARVADRVLADVKTAVRA